MADITIKKVKIDGREIPMKATASSPRIYRTVFGGDLLLEIQEIKDRFEKSEPFNLEVIENMAYLFAYQANPDIEDIDTWLDKFSIGAIYNAATDIFNLWKKNEESKSTAKKQAAR